MTGQPFVNPSRTYPRSQFGDQLEIVLAFDFPTSNTSGVGLAPMTDEVQVVYLDAQGETVEVLPTPRVSVSISGPEEFGDYYAAGVASLTLVNPLPAEVTELKVSRHTVASWGSGANRLPTPGTLDSLRRGIQKIFRIVQELEGGASVGGGGPSTGAIQQLLAQIAVLVDEIAANTSSIRDIRDNRAFIDLNNISQEGIDLIMRFAGGETITAAQLIALIVALTDTQDAAVRAALDVYSKEEIDTAISDASGTALDHVDRERLDGIDVEEGKFLTVGQWNGTVDYGDPARRLTATDLLTDGATQTDMSFNRASLPGDLSGAVGTPFAYPSSLSSTRRNAIAQLLILELTRRRQICTYAASSIPTEIIRAFYTHESLIPGHQTFESYFTCGLSTSGQSNPGQVPTDRITTITFLDGSEVERSGWFPDARGKVVQYRLNAAGDDFILDTFGDDSTVMDEFQLNLELGHHYQEKRELDTLSFNVRRGRLGVPTDGLTENGDGTYSYPVTTPGLNAGDLINSDASTWTGLNDLRKDVKASNEIHDRTTRGVNGLEDGTLRSTYDGQNKILAESGYQRRSLEKEALEVDVQNNLRIVNTLWQKDSLITYFNPRGDTVESGHYPKPAFNDDGVLGVLGNVSTVRAINPGDDIKIRNLGTTFGGAVIYNGQPAVFIFRDGETNLSGKVIIELWIEITNILNDIPSFNHIRLTRKGETGHMSFSGLSGLTSGTSLKTVDSDGNVSASKRAVLFRFYSESGGFVSEPEVLTLEDVLQGFDSITLHVGAGDTVDSNLNVPAETTTPVIRAGVGTKINQLARDNSREVSKWVRDISDWFRIDKLVVGNMLDTGELDPNEAGEINTDGITINIWNDLPDDRYNSAGYRRIVASGLVAGVVYGAPGVQVGFFGSPGIRDDGVRLLYKALDNCSDSQVEIFVREVSIDGARIFPSVTIPGCDPVIITTEDGRSTAVSRVERMITRFSDGSVKQFNIRLPEGVSLDAALTATQITTVANPNLWLSYYEEVMAGDDYDVLVSDQVGRGALERDLGSVYFQRNEETLIAIWLRLANMWINLGFNVDDLANVARVLTGSRDPRPSDTLPELEAKTGLYYYQIIGDKLVAFFLKRDSGWVLLATYGDSLRSGHGPPTEAAGGEAAGTYAESAAVGIFVSELSNIVDTGTSLGHAYDVTNNGQKLAVQFGADVRIAQIVFYSTGRALFSVIGTHATYEYPLEIEALVDGVFTRWIQQIGDAATATGINLTGTNFSGTTQTYTLYSGKTPTANSLFARLRGHGVDIHANKTITLDSSLLASEEVAEDGSLYIELDRENPIIVVDEWSRENGKWEKLYGGIARARLLEASIGLVDGGFEVDNSYTPVISGEPAGLGLFNWADSQGNVYKRSKTEKTNTAPSTASIVGQFARPSGYENGTGFKGYAQWDNAGSTYCASVIHGLRDGESNAKITLARIGSTALEAQNDTTDVPTFIGASELAIGVQPVVGIDHYAHNGADRLVVVVTRRNTTLNQYTYVLFSGFITYNNDGIQFEQHTPHSFDTLIPVTGDIVWEAINDSNIQINSVQRFVVLHSYEGRFAISAYHRRYVDNAYQLDLSAGREILHLGPPGKVGEGRGLSINAAAGALTNYSIATNKIITEWDIGNIPNRLTILEDRLEDGGIKLLGEIKTNIIPPTTTFISEASTPDITIPANGLLGYRASLRTGAQSAQNIAMVPISRLPNSFNTADYGDVANLANSTPCLYVDIDAQLDASIILINFGRSSSNKLLFSITDTTLTNRYSVSFYSIEVGGGAVSGGAVSGGGLTEAEVDARVRAGTADFAEEGNTSIVPNNKLPATATRTDAAINTLANTRIAANVKDFAETATSVADTQSGLRTAIGQTILTQAAYDALTPVDGHVYIIVG